MNHFIEIQKDENGYIWIMLHSGSRNLGKKVADHYNKVAEELNALYYSSVTKDMQLAFLPVRTLEFKQYMAEMEYCVQFAQLNRETMMNKIQQIFEKVMGEISFSGTINIAHNYARWENWGGKNVIVHRKGATYVDEKTFGIIPGSMGTSSYIVKGLGNAQSLNSCSHGAGRTMGRKQATQQLNLEETIKSLDDKGIIHGIRNTSDLEEAPLAYKNIDEVMENQKDLVKIIVKLKPLAVVKG